MIDAAPSFMSVVSFDSFAVWIFLTLIYFDLFLGRKFDKNGDIVKEWWSASALKEFNTRAGCIRDQYSRYKVQDKYRVSISFVFTFCIQSKILQYKILLSDTDKLLYDTTRTMLSKLRSYCSVSVSIGFY